MVCVFVDIWISNLEIDESYLGQVPSSTVRCDSSRILYFEEGEAVENVGQKQEGDSETSSSGIFEMATYRIDFAGIRPRSR